MISRQFIMFLITSSAAAVVNIVSRFGFSYIMNYDAAIILAYFIGMATAYILAKLYVFAPSGKTTQTEMRGFFLVNMIALFQVWAVSILLARWFFPLVDFNFHPELFAHIMGVASPAFTSYFGHKYISFGKNTQ